MFLSVYSNCGAFVTESHRQVWSKTSFQMQTSDPHSICVAVCSMQINLVRKSGLQNTESLGRPRGEGLGFIKGYRVYKG